VRRRQLVDAGPPWFLLERRAASAEKLAPPRWPPFMASPTLHHPVSESKSDLVSTSRADVITQNRGGRRQSNHKGRKSIGAQVVRSYGESGPSAVCVGA
jgi:hypothetical protein